MLHVIYIIVVTYNGAKWIQKCIYSSLASDIPVKIIVVDNGSTDDTLDIIRKFQSDNIEIIETGENLGFGKANNRGIQVAIDANADYVYLLNQDAYLEPNTLSELLVLDKAYPGYGALSPMQYDGIGASLDKNFESLSYRLAKPDTRTNLLFETDFVMAAHLLLPTAVIRKLGGFNPLFKHYGEDGDLLNRIKYNGYKVGFASNVKAMHDRALREVPPSKQLTVWYRSYLAVAVNPNISGFAAFKNISKFIIFDFLSRIKKRQFSVLATHVKETSNFLRILPSIIQTRKKYQQHLSVGLITH